jgi:hypothetical protein
MDEPETTTMVCIYYLVLLLILKLHILHIYVIILGIKIYPWNHIIISCFKI